MEPIHLNLELGFLADCTKVIMGNWAFGKEFITPIWLITPPLNQPRYSVVIAKLEPLSTSYTKASLQVLLQLASARVPHTPMSTPYPWGLTQSRMWLFRVWHPGCTPARLCLWALGLYLQVELVQVLVQAEHQDYPLGF